MRSHVLTGGVLLCWFVASFARAEPVQISFVQEPAKAEVTGGGRTHKGWRLAPGSQIQLDVKGPGELKVFYFQEYSPGKPFPTDVRLLVSVDGAGKMFPLTPKPLPGMAFGGPKGKTLPSAPNPVALTMAAGEHRVVLKLAATSELGGVVAFPEARTKGADLDLDLDGLAALPPGSGGLDLELDMDAPVAPAKGKPGPKKPELALDLDMDLPPAPGVKPPPAKAGLELDLDEPPIPPAAALPKPTAGLLATSKAPPAAPVAPLPKPTAGLLADAKAPAKAPAAKAPDALPPPKPFLPPEVAKKDPSPPVVAVAAPPEPEPFVPEPPPPPPEPDLPPPPLGRVEVGLRAGYALARGSLAARGQPIGIVEVGLRLEGMPTVRVTVAGSGTFLAGSVAGFDGMRGRGQFLQSTYLVPLEVGAAWEPISLGRLTPYLGLALSGGVAQTSMQRYSLRVEQAAGASFGATVAAGLRYQVVGTSVLVVEARQSESFASVTGVTRFGERTLSTTAFDGGLLFTF